MGQTITKQNDIEAVFFNYFQDLFSTTNPSKVQLDACLKSIKYCVNPSMNEHLQLPFTRGVVHVSSCCNRSIKHQQAIAQALALQEALAICNELNLTRVSFECNCKKVVNTVNAKKIYFSTMYPIIYEAQLLLQHHPYWRVQFSPRSSNKVAHHLIKLACSMQGKFIWIGKCPIQIMSCVVSGLLCNHSS